ncbi:16S rRNA (uracil(1498)-N(3))-methyltransferase [Algiphilus aromaticivorans]|jgi:16S rRNA (uracil1498-N3)-methyltransferase|uniref:16S rRNA (uracil(1498)-N(3))-methyltransferase n=1 Tax=Algiphilus aromaticivorans TaxID=382454 RepID=UPI0005C1CC25|nr:16S rRNA (uracil(1498)-N(3))-methyltransferase [Algiphilus aromaticivorans]
MPRIYISTELTANARLRIEGDAFNHTVRVLRLRSGDALTVFNGDGHEYPAHIEVIERQHALLALSAPEQPEVESPLATTLLQAVSKGERMDWALQKATELGVTRIRPIITARCNVKLDTKRWQKKMAHWQGVITSACEQSGRLRLPELLPVAELQAALAEVGPGLRLTLDFGGGAALPRQAPEDGVTLLVGPEGGLSEEEIASARAAGFHGWRIGPRVLRTETAPVAALALLQQRYGDLGGTQ